MFPRRAVDRATIVTREVGPRSHLLSSHFLVGATYTWTPSAASASPWRYSRTARTATACRCRRRRDGSRAGTPAPGRRRSARACVGPLVRDYVAACVCLIRSSDGPGWQRRGALLQCRRNHCSTAPLAFRRQWWLSLRLVPSRNQMGCRYVLSALLSVAVGDSDKGIFVRPTSLEGTKIADMPHLQRVRRRTLLQSAREAEASPRQ